MGVTVSGSLPIINEARIQAAISQAGNMAGQEIVKRARDGILSGAKSGRHYPGLPNQSSAPGEYSANQSGDLLNSINYRMSGIFSPSTRPRATPVIRNTAPRKWARVRT